MSDFFKLVFYRAGAAFGTLFFSVLITFYYSDDITEKIFSITLVLYLLSIASRSGFELLIVKDYHALTCKNKPEWFGNMLSIVFVLSAIYGALYYFIDLFFLKSGNELWVVVNLLPFSSLLIFSYYFRAKEFKFLSALVEHGSLFLIVSVFIVAAKLIGLPIENPMIILTILNWIFFFLILILLLKFNLVQFSFTRFTIIKKLLISGSPFMLLAIASYVTLWIPAFIIKTESAKAFIDYNLAVRLLAPVTFIITAVDFYLSSHFSKAKKEGDTTIINDLFYQFRRFFLFSGVSYIVLTSVLLFYAISYFDEVTHQIVLFYGVVLSGYFISCLIGPCGILLNMYGLVKYANYATLISAFLVTILVIPIFNVFGALGAVVLVASSILLRNSMMYFILKNYKVLV